MVVGQKSPEKFEIQAENSGVRESSAISFVRIILPESVWSVNQVDSNSATMRRVYLSSHPIEFWLSFLISVFELVFLRKIDWSLENILMRLLQGLRRTEFVDQFKVQIKDVLNLFCPRQCLSLQSRSYHLFFRLFGKRDSMLSVGQSHLFNVQVRFEICFLRSESRTNSRIGSRNKFWYAGDFREE